MLASSTQLFEWGPPQLASASPPPALFPRSGCRPGLSLCLQVVEKGGPYPLIILPQFGGYWIEDPENLGTPTSLGSSTCEEDEEDSLSPNAFGYKLECRGEARAYRRHFLGKVRPGHWDLGGEGAQQASSPLLALLAFCLCCSHGGGRMCLSWRTGAVGKQEAPCDGSQWGPPPALPQPVF